MSANVTPERRCRGVEILNAALTHARRSAKLFGSLGMNNQMSVVRALVAVGDTLERLVHQELRMCAGKFFRFSRFPIIEFPLGLFNTRMFLHKSHYYR